MSPVFGHGHLRLYLLRLLDESPKHGYELIQALSERFGGTYSPSAGTIYPRLAKLEEEGLVTKSSDGRKTVYTITEAGRRELEARSGELDDIEAELSDSVRRLADEVRSGVDRAMRSLKADLASAAREARQGGRDEQASAASDAARARQRSADALRDAELAITEFRQDLRADLRTAAARGELGPDTVSTIKRGLDQLVGEVRASLRRSA